MAADAHMLGDASLTHASTAQPADPFRAAFSDPTQHDGGQEQNCQDGQDDGENGRHGGGGVWCVVVGGDHPPACGPL